MSKLIWLILLFPLAANGEFLQLSKLDFGEIVLTDNSFSSELRLMPDGTYQVTGNIYVITDPEPAHFSVSNAKKNALLSFSDNTPVFISQPDNALFSLKELNYPTNVITDDFGNATFSVGGVLKSSGDDKNINSDSIYNLKYRLRVNY